MADKKISGPTPDAQEINIEVQGDQFETLGFFSPPIAPVTYADVLFYANGDKESKAPNYLAWPPGGANNLLDWHPQLGFPINGLGFLEHPPWIPPLHLPQIRISSQHCATVRRRCRATIRRRQMQIWYMPGSLLHSLQACLQRPFGVRAPSFARGRIMVNRRQPECSRCGAIGHNIRTCGKTA